jgi:hypothetical protein
MSLPNYKNSGEYTYQDYKNSINDKESKEEVSSTEPMTRCTICLEEFKSDVKIKILSCNHLYHVDCITRWLSSHLQCPCCRSESISIEDIEKFYNESKDKDIELFLKKYRERNNTEPSPPNRNNTRNSTNPLSYLYTNPNAFDDALLNFIFEYRLTNIRDMEEDDPDYVPSDEDTRSNTNNYQRFLNANDSILDYYLRPTTTTSVTPSHHVYNNSYSIFNQYKINKPNPLYNNIREKLKLIH